MDLKACTVLITGGTSGIGREIATQLLAKGAKVIVTGRDQIKLDEVKRAQPQVHTIKSDVADPKAIQALFQVITSQYPDTNVLINNAGVMRKLNLHDESKTDLVDFTSEIETNLMGPIRMAKIFLPFLKDKKSAAIVNVSSGLAFVPFAIAPVYSATKAGLHSFTQALRIQLKSTSVKVFELAPPGTETPLFRGKEFSDADLAGIKGMDVKVLAKAAIDGLERDTLEIRPGLANALMWMGRVAPNFAATMLGKNAEAMISSAKSKH